MLADGIRPYAKMANYCRTNLLRLGWIESTFVGADIIRQRFKKLQNRGGYEVSASGSKNLQSTNGKQNKRFKKNCKMQTENKTRANNIRPYKKIRGRRHEI